MAYPKLSEFHSPACTCGGTVTGCGVCACGDLLLAFGLSIPRTSTGSPDMRALGKSMGARHRAVAAVNHGLSLVSTAYCDTGTWCAFCITLELRARGLPASYQRLSWDQILANARRGLPQAIRLWYGYLPRVSATSYSSTVPARGRSDSFIRWHLFVMWSAGNTEAIISDSDFGSGSRPIIPPYSRISLSDLHNAWAAGNSGTCVVNRVPAFELPPPSSTTTTAHPEEDMLKYMPPITVPQRMMLKKGQRLYSHPGGPRVTSMSKDAAVAHLGSGSSRAGGHAWRQVVVGTGVPYSDGKSRRTGLWVPADAGKVVNV